MKLLKLEACPWASGRGNVKIRTALGDAQVLRLSDRGSTPLASTNETLDGNVEGFARLVRKYKINKVNCITTINFFK